jgi:amidophosphoribosyltransferase
MVLASVLDRFTHYPFGANNIFNSMNTMHPQLHGAYSCVAMIISHGLLVFCDPNRMRPL